MHIYRKMMEIPPPPAEKDGCYSSEEEDVDLTLQYGPDESRNGRVPCCFFLALNDLKSLQIKYPKKVRREWKQRMMAHDATMLVNEGYLEYIYSKGRLQLYTAWLRSRKRNTAA